MLNLLRWTSQRTIKETFVPPTDFPYPHMERSRRPSVWAPDGDPRRAATHLAIERACAASRVELGEGRAGRLETVPEMAPTSAVWYTAAFVFSLADYCAMLAVNEPNVVLGSAQDRFLASRSRRRALEAEATWSSATGASQRSVVDVERAATSCVFSRRVQLLRPDRHMLARQRARRRSHERRRPSSPGSSSATVSSAVHALRRSHLADPGGGEAGGIRVVDVRARGRRGLRGRRVGAADRGARSGGGDRRARGHQHHHRGQERPDGPVAGGAPGRRHRHDPQGRGSLQDIDQLALFAPHVKWQASARPGARARRRW